MIIKNKRLIKLIVVFTMIPLLSSCQLLSNNLFKQVALYIGKVLADTVTGNAIESILDDVLGKISTPKFKSSGLTIPEIEVNKRNSLKGRYPDTLKLVGKKIKNNQESREIIELNIDMPRLIKKNPSSNWEIAPDLKQLITQVFKRKFDEKETNSSPQDITFGDIIPNTSDLLEGSYSQTMKISGRDKSGEKVEFFIDKPVMLRQYKGAKWNLASDLKQVLDQVITNYD